MAPGVEQVHVTAPAAAEPGCPPEDLGRHRIQVNALRDREVMGSVGRGDRVAGVKVSAHARGNGFLPGRQVHLTWHEPGPDVECGFLSA